MGELQPSEIERIKLTAGFFNAIASGVFITSIVAPFIGAALGTVQVTADIAGAGSLSALGLTVAVVLHLVARRILLGLDR